MPANWTLRERIRQGAVSLPKRTSRGGIAPTGLEEEGFGGGGGRVGRARKRTQPAPPTPPIPENEIEDTQDPQDDRPEFVNTESDPVVEVLTADGTPSEYSVKFEVNDPDRVWTVELDRSVDLNDPDISVEVLGIEIENNKIGSRLGVVQSITSTTPTTLRIAFDNKLPIVGSVTITKSTLNRVINFYETMILVLDSLDSNNKLDMFAIKDVSRTWTIESNMKDPQAVAIDDHGNFLFVQNTVAENDKVTVTLDKPAKGTLILMRYNKLLNTVQNVMDFISNFLLIIAIIIPILEIIERVKAAQSTLPIGRPESGATISSAASAISRGKSTLVKIEAALVTLKGVSYFIRGHEQRITKKRDRLKSKIEDKLAKAKAERRKLETTT